MSTSRRSFEAPGTYIHIYHRESKLIEIVPVTEFLTNGNLNATGMSMVYSFVGLHVCTSSRARHHMETHERTINKMQRPDIMEAIRVALHKILSRRHSKTKMRQTDVKRTNGKKNDRESRS